MLHKRICVICGGTFYSPRRDSITCSEVCRRKRQTLIRKEKQAVEKVETKRQPARKSNLANKNAEARSQGMTYGRYMAQEYAKKIKVEI